MPPPAAADAIMEAADAGVPLIVCITEGVPVTDMDPEQWRRVVRVNLDGVVWCYQAAVPGMIRRRRGSIIAFTSGLAAQGWPEASAYAATKAALIAFAKSAARPESVFNVCGLLNAPKAGARGADSTCPLKRNAMAAVASPISA